MLNVLLIGMGAMGSEVLRHLGLDHEIRITHALVRSINLSAGCQHKLGSIALVRSVEEIQSLPDFALECAGVSAVGEHLIPLLERGVDVAICSTAALVDEALAARLKTAAIAGNSQVHIVAGAIGGIDAIASAKLIGLKSVSLTSRKPPAGWIGTPAEQLCDLRSLAEPTVIFRGCSRRAAELYPKNANVAATVALAGVGLDKTMVTLIADPGVTSNQHEIVAQGAFGEMRSITRNQAFSENPKTSMLAALSAIRTLRNQVAAITI